MPLFYQDDIYFEHQVMAEIGSRRASWDALSTRVTPTMAANTLRIASLYPNMPNSVLQGAAALGTPADDPVLADIAIRVAEKEKAGWDRLLSAAAKPFEWGANLFTGTTGAAKIGLRTAFLTFDGIMDEGVLRPFRTLVGFASQSVDQNDPEARRLAADGLSLAESYNLAGDSIAVRAIKERAAGREVNLGSGFIPKSNPIEEDPDYKQLIRDGFSPMEAAGMIQEANGIPITQIRDREAARLQFQGQPISPGRVSVGLLDRATGSTVFQPGGLPFNFLSGLVDGAVQIGLDPTGVGLAKVAKAAKFNRGLHAAGTGAYNWQKALKLDGPLSRVLPNYNPGLARGHRPFIMDRFAGDFVTEQRGAGKLWDVMSRNVGQEGMTKNFRTLERAMDVAPDIDLVRRITDEIDPRKIEAMVAPYLGREISRKPVATSFLGRLLTGSDTSIGSAAGRMVGKIPGSGVDEAEGALFGFQYAVRNRFGQDKMGRLLSRSANRIGIRVDDINQASRDVNDWMFGVGFNKADRGAALREMSTLRDGNAAGIYKIMRSNARRLRHRMVEEGVDPKHARSATRILERNFENLDEARRYFGREMGEHLWFPGAETKFLPDGTIEILPSAHTMSEHAMRFIPLPDPRKIRRAFSKMRKLVAKEDLNERWFVYAADSWMEGFWKPSVLLRVAWPMRVILEEQVRMAAAGFDSAFKHPFSWLAWTMAKPAQFDEAGRVIAGAKGRGAVSEVEHSMEMRAAHTRVTSLGKTPGQLRGQRRSLLKDPAYTTAHIGDDSYFDDLTFEMGQLWYDDVAPEVVRLTPAGAPRSSDEALDWFVSGEGREMRMQLASEGQEIAPRSRGGLPRDPGLTEKVDPVTGEISDLGDLAAAEAAEVATVGSDQALYGSEDAWLLGADDADFARSVGMEHNPAMAEAAARSYLDSIWARANYLAGGDFRVHKLAGHNRIGQRIRYQYEILPGANEDLLKTFSTRELVTPGTGRNINIDDVRKSNSHKPFKGVTDVLADDAGIYGTARPRTLKTTVGGSLDMTQGRYERMIDRMFTMLMGVPTNKLSRAPVFRQSWWKAMEDLAVRLGPEDRARLLKLADEANIPPRTIKVIKDAPLTTDADALISFADAEHLSKARALEETRSLLYDLSQKSQAADVMRNFTPFAEAWWEIFSTWTRIVSHNPQILRRTQQVYEGAREADPFNTGNGFFHVNPETGDEVFAYPLVGGLVAGVTGFGSAGVGSQARNDQFDAGTGPDQIAGTPLEFTGSVQGLNLFAGSVIPGFGPVVQFPVSALVPDIPQLDFIRQRVIPFGEIGIDEIAGVRALPAAWRKFLGPISDSDPNVARLQNNTIIESYRALILSGAYDVASENPQRARAEMTRALDQAKTTSNWMMVVRGIAQFILPSAPAPKYQIELEESTNRETAGQVFSISTLSQEWHEKLNTEFNGDTVEATAWFLDKYGLEPYIFATPKTVTLRRRTLTASGSRFQRLNPELFKTAPLTAYYAQPDDPEEAFDYSSYLRQIREGSRVPLTPDQWAQRRNHLLGSLRYETERTRPDVVALRATNPRAVSVYLRAQRQYLRERYFGYDRPIVGVPTTAGLTETIDEFVNIWPDNDKLRNSQVGPSLMKYLALRQEAIDYAVDNLGLAPNSFRSARSAEGIRAWLRQEAEHLYGVDPNFLILWQFVFSKELADADAGLTPTESNEPTANDYVLLGLDPPGRIIAEERAA